MAEYIDKSFVLYVIRHFGSMRTWSKSDIISECVRKITSEKAADVVPVVRCKECAHVNVEVRDYAMYLPKQCELYCKLDELPVKPDDFCSYGERKEED